MAVKKVFQPVGVTFKGDGFYKTDSRGDVESRRRGRRRVLELGRLGWHHGLRGGSGDKKTADTPSTTSSKESKPSTSTSRRSRPADRRSRPRIVEVDRRIVDDEACQRLSDAHPDQRRRSRAGRRDRDHRWIGLLRVSRRPGRDHRHDAVRRSGVADRGRHDRRSESGVPPPPRPPSRVRRAPGAVPRQRLGDGLTRRAFDDRAVLGGFPATRDPSRRVRRRRPTRRSHHGSARHVPRRRRTPRQPGFRRFGAPSELRRSLRRRPARDVAAGGGNDRGDGA